MNTRDNGTRHSVEYYNVSTKVDPFKFTLIPVNFPIQKSIDLPIFLYGEIFYLVQLVNEISYQLHAMFKENRNSHKSCSFLWSK